MLLSQGQSQLEGLQTLPASTLTHAPSRHRRTLAWPEAAHQAALVVFTVGAVPMRAELVPVVQRRRKVQPATAQAVAEPTTAWDQRRFVRLVSHPLVIVRPPVVSTL